MDQQRFLHQLQIVLDPKKGDVKAATNILQNEYYKQPQALLFLIQLIISHDSPDLKQLAATQAKPLVSKQWTRIPDAQRKSARTQLFQATMSEQNSLVRHSAARLVGTIAKMDLEDGDWAELPQQLQQAATSNKADERAVGVYLLYSILEVMGDGFSSKFKALFELFSRTIKDPESLEVRVNTTLALSRMAMVIDAEEDQASVKAFQTLFPAMVQVLQDTIQSGKEEQAMLVFEVFNILLTAEYQLMQNHFQDLMELMNKIATTTDFADEARTQAISFLLQAVIFRKLRVQGMKLGIPLVKSMLPIVAEIEDVNDDDEVLPGRSALSLIESMSQYLPAQHVVAPLIDMLPEFSQSRDPARRRAGILALGYVVEGAPDFMSTQLPRIFPILFTLLADPDATVRQCALMATARLADDLPSDISKEHEKIMPLLAKSLTEAMQSYKGEEEGPVIDIMRHSVSAIDAVVDGMDAADATPYLDRLVPMLQKLLQHPDLKIKAAAATAIGSLASTVEAPFKPYLADSMQAMQVYITKKESEEELDLRASCTDAMGEMAVAVGAADFKNYVRPLMQASEEALKLEHSRLKESTYILWGSLAKVYEEDFSPFLAGVVKGLFECIDQDEGDLEVELGEAAKDLAGKEVTIAGRKVKIADTLESGDDEDEIEDVDIDEDSDEWDDLTTVTPLAMEKEIAIEVIGDVVGNTKTAFMPYFEKTIAKLLPLCEHSYENVRKAAFSTLHRAYGALYEVQEESGAQAKWEPGLPLKVKPTTELQKLGDVIMTATLNSWADEDEPAVVNTISQSLSENLKMTGPALIANENHLRQVVQAVSNIITKKHPCQQEIAEEELDVEDMDSTELDWLIIDSAMDVISGLAAALGPTFIELWKVFEKPVLRYASGAESLGRASACGVLAEVIVGMDSAVTGITPQLTQILLKRMSDEDDQTKSNAAYAVGRLVEKSTDAKTLAAAYPQILSKLENLLTIDNARCKDNAAGCVARLILKNKSLVPVKDVLPVLVTTILPLKDDYQENEPVWRMIIQLYREQDSTVLGLTRSLAPIMMSVLGEPEEQLTDEVRAELTQLVEHLKSVH